MGEEGFVWGERVGIGTTNLFFFQRDCRFPQPAEAAALQERPSYSLSFFLCDPLLPPFFQPETEPENRIRISMRLGCAVLCCAGLRRKQHLLYSIFFWINFLSAMPGV
jgi:hypothetical protein